MPLDPNIILQAQAPRLDNPLDSMAKAMTLKQLSQQSQINDQQIQQNQGLKDAFARNVVTNPDGSTSLNKQGVLADLYKVNPQKAIDYDKLFQGQDLEKMAADTAKMKNIAWSMTPQNYSQLRQKAIDMKIPNSEQLPPNYDDQIVKSLQYHTLTGEEQLNQRMKQQELDIKKKGQDIELGKSFGFGNIPGALQPGGTAQPQAAGAAASQATDPATLVKYYVPEKHQEKAFAEIRDAQNIKENGGKILENFDNAVKNFHGVDLIPGTLSADQKAYHATLAPTFKDVTGTVKESEMKNMFESTTPQAGDSKDTIATKRKALITYLQGKSAAPVSKGFGIDLSKFPSTAVADVGQTNPAPSGPPVFKTSEIEWK